MKVQMVVMFYSPFLNTLLYEVFSSFAHTNNHIFSALHKTNTNIIKIRRFPSTKKQTGYDSLIRNLQLR